MSSAVSYLCYHCSSLFPSMEEITVHQLECGATRSSETTNNVVNSESATNVTPNAMMYECTHCFQVFPSIEGLQEHALICNEKDRNEDPKKRIIWSDGMTKCLLSVYIQFRHQMDDIEYTKKKVFGMIAEEMSIRGFPGLSSDACHAKWKSLKRRYKEIVAKKKRTGEASYRFAYFKLMDDILAKDHDINPPVVYESSSSGPRYRDDAAETTETVNSAETEVVNSHSTSVQNLEEETTPKRGQQRRELPYWCHAYFKKIDNIQASRAKEREMREAERKKKEEDRKIRAAERQRREEERQRRHDERQSVKMEILNVLRDFTNKK